MTAGGCCGARCKGSGALTMWGEVSAIRARRSTHRRERRLLRRVGLPIHLRADAIYVENDHGTLVVTPKQTEVPWPPIARIFFSWQRNSSGWQRYLDDNRDLFTTNYRWNSAIRYTIRSPAMCPIEFQAGPEDL